MSLNHVNVPGSVVTHSAAESGLYIGSPSLCVLPNGDYLVSHDFFGPESNEHSSPNVMILKSSDSGVTWESVTTLENGFWHGLFMHNDIPYIMGTDKHHGNIVIRKSLDGGQSWTSPVDASSGLITSNGQYHTSTMPVIEHNGRLWRAFEDAMGGDEWGLRYRAGMLSIPVEADLLDASNWTISNFLPGDPEWIDGSFNGWLEGNAVITPDGDMVNVIRIDSHLLPEKAAILQLSENGKEISFDLESGLIDFPGGSKKFTIRYDEESKTYYSLASIIADDFVDSAHPMKIRNTLALISSEDLMSWRVDKVLIHHEDRANHGFQYVDWAFEGNDIISVCRTSFEDGLGGAHSNHDANFVTFNRWHDFRLLNTRQPKP